MIIKSFIRGFKYLFRPFYRSFVDTLTFFWDARLNATLAVKESGKVIFKIIDFGGTVRYRASSFETKEPETLNWIRGFDYNENLLDIGANIGIYSLYAAYKGINVISIEPDALNYALLNLNIRMNNLRGEIVPYCVAIHDKSKFSKFNISSYSWGGALNSFDNTLNFKGEEYTPIHYQGIFGISLDSFVDTLTFIPNHLKIDVDGNEHLILLGAKEFLKNKNLKSILVELDEEREDYELSKNLIEQSGFKLMEKTNSVISVNGKFSTIFNHIYIR